MHLDGGSLAARAAGELSTARCRTTTRGIADSATASRSPAGPTTTSCPRRSRTPSCRFALGVQWHPEADPESQIVAALVDGTDGRKRDVAVIGGES